MSKRLSAACLVLGMSVPFVQAQSLAGTIEITYENSVAQIMRENCVVCHNPSGIGPFSLQSYDEVRRRARQISEVTESHYMPPWKPEEGYGPKLLGERRLSDEQIQMLRNWHASGMEAGDLSNIPSSSAIDTDWALGEPDLVITLPEAYELVAEGEDVYRNFVISIPIEETKHVRAFELQPQTRLAIHHALLMIDKTGRSRERDEEEPGPGFGGMGIGSSEPPNGHILGWTPGQAPYEAYPGTAWEMSPKHELVLQLHLLPTGKAEKINPRLGFYFSDEPPTLAAHVFQLRKYSIDIPAGEANYLVESSLEISADMKVVGVYPHAHFIGKNIEIFATLPNGEKLPLLRIRDWDFNWQGDYRFEEPVSIRRGSKLHMAYIFDNSENNPRNPSSPPRRVTSGWRSIDEMAEAMIQVVPDDPDELEILVKDQLKYEFDGAGGEALYHYYNGIYLEQQHELDRAKTAFLNCLDLDPDFADAYYKLGAIFEFQGDVQQAEGLYKEALAYKPHLTPAKLGLAKILFQKNQIRQAGFILKEVYSEDPYNMQGAIYLSRYYVASNDNQKALEVLRQGKPKFTGNANYHLELGKLLLTMEDSELAKEQFNQAIEFEPAFAPPGSEISTKKLQAAAHYFLATLQNSDGELQTALDSVTAALDKYPEYLDALLLSAQLFLAAGKQADTQQQLEKLIGMPEERTFHYRDIIENLPLPEGALLLSEAYLEVGKIKQASDCLTYALGTLNRQYKGEAATQIQAALDRLLVK